MIESYAERIAGENEGMREWEETMVRNAGYTYGNEIKRETITDASVFNAVKKTQKVHKYKNFETVLPSVSINFGESESSSGIMRKIKNAQEALNIWDEESFGEKVIEKTSDGKEYQTRKQHVIAHDIAELAETDNYKKSENTEDVLEYKKLLKKQQLTEKEQERLGNLSRNIVTVRDGAFGEYLGYAPTFKFM